MRAWDYDDYLDAQEALGEVPLVDEAFFLSFCKPSSEPVTGVNLKTPEGRKAFLEQQGKRSV